MSDTTAENVADRSHVAPDETARSSYADKIVQCPICDGTGKSSCADCKGIGKIKCDRCSGDGKIDCPVCGDGVGNHRGKVRKSRLKNCPNCNGTGRALVKELGGKRWADCCQCGGSGQVDDYYWDLCPNCHGDYAKIKACPDCDGKGEHECKSCHGEGMVICHVCKGKGNASIATILHEWRNGKERKEIISRLGKTLDELAKHGDGAFLCALGQFYWDGDDSDPNAIKYWKMAAELGYPEGQEWCGECYYNGYGCEVDKRAALEWYGKAAAQGLSYSLERLIHMRMMGEGDVADLEKALNGFKTLVKLPAKNEDKEYMQKHIELLPRIIKGDLDAMKKLHGWLKTNSGRLEVDWQEPWMEHLGKMIRETENRLPEKAEEKTDGNVAKTLEMSQESTPTTSRKDDAIANTFKDLPKSKPSVKPGSTFPSSKKRWLFVMIGLVFGLFGLQFVYAGRWKFFFAHWLSIIAGGAVFPVFLIVPLVLWFGSVLFMKRDGKGCRM